MSRYLVFIIVFILGEVVAFILFLIIRYIWDVDKKGFNWTAIGIGVLERLVLFFGMAMNITQVIILFGALKIGTMVSAKKEKSKDLDYFLVGNLTSVLLALFYIFFYQILGVRYM